MSDDLLKSKIELIQAQIDNLEKSGFFTEKVMDKLSFPLREELNVLQTQLSISNINEMAVKIGNTPAQVVEGRRIFSNLWGKIDEVKYKTANIQVIDAQILTPNHQEA